MVGGSPNGLLQCNPRGRHARAVVLHACVLFVRARVCVCVVQCVSSEFVYLRAFLSNGLDDAFQNASARHR